MEGKELGHHSSHEKKSRRESIDLEEGEIEDSRDGTDSNSNSSDVSFSDEDVPLKTGFTLNEVLQILPWNEVQIRLFGMLDLQSKRRCRLVCKDWKNFLDGITQFEVNFDEYTSKEVQEFASVHKTIKTLSVSINVDFSYPPNGIGFTSIKTLVVKPFSNPFYDVKLGISEPNLRTILDEFSSIESLKLHSGAFGNISHPSFLRNVSLPELKSLEMLCSNMDVPNGFRVAGDILENKFAKLDWVDFTLINCVDDNDEDESFFGPLFYLKVFQFIANHADTLKNVTLAFGTNLSDFELQILVNIMGIHLDPFEHILTDEDFNKLMENLGSTQLKTFTFIPHIYEGLFGYRLANKLISSQNFLTRLHIEFPKAQIFLDLWQDIPQVLAKCSQTLEEVELHICLCSVEERHIFSCSYVKDCTRLKSLVMDLCGFRLTEIEQLPNQIEELNLGHGVSRAQINFVTHNLTKVKEWVLMQGQAKTHRNIPKIDARMMRRIMKMPNMQVLGLCQQASEYKKIKRITWAVPGLNIKTRNEALKFYDVIVDKKLFNRKKFY